MSESRVFKLGTRSSPLAMWQAERVQSRLIKAIPGVKIQIIKIQTIGDKILDKPLVQVGGKGIFTKEIEDALLSGDVDFAVHSFKDLPTVQPDGLAIVCIPERTTPHDALFSKTGGTLGDLPKAPVIATGSLRRKAQILSLIPDATVVDIRGNVNTRLKKYQESNWDGLIMAGAAIERMEWDEPKAALIPTHEMLPAPAQGALAIEARIEDEEIKEILRRIHDNKTAPSVLAERAFLAQLEGGCQVPIAAHAAAQNKQLVLEGLIAGLDGKDCLRKSKKGSTKNPVALGVSLAKELLESGGDQIIEELKAMNETRPDKPEPPR